MNKGGFYIFLGFVSICVGGLLYQVDALAGLIITGVAAFFIVLGFREIKDSEAAADTEKNQQ